MSAGPNVWRMQKSKARDNLPFANYQDIVVHVGDGNDHEAQVVKCRSCAALDNDWLGFISILKKHIFNFGLASQDIPYYQYMNDVWFVVIKAMGEMI